MKTLIFVDNVAEPHNAKSYECESITDKLADLLPTFPKTARIYHETLSVNHDVTPHDEFDVEYLESLEGRFYVLIYPQEAYTAIIYLVVAIVLAVVAYVLAPTLAAPDAQAKPKESPNAGLSDRTNQVRIKGRIPDIYGEVISVLDLLQLPFKVFKDNVEYELSYMAIGRGEYEILEVKDGDSLFSEIPEAWASVWAPYTSPISDGLGYVEYGTNVLTNYFNGNFAPEYNVGKITRSNSVDGQTLLPPNFKKYQATSNVRFQHPNIIKTSSGASVVDFRDYFEPGDQIVVTNATDTKNSITVNLNDTYEVNTVSQDTMTVNDPNADWALVAGMTGNETNLISPTLNASGTTDNWVGPFILPNEEIARIYVNVVAPNGLQKRTTSGKLRPHGVSVEIEVYRVNSSNVKISGSEFLSSDGLGSSFTQPNFAAVTVIPSGSFDDILPGQKMAVRVRRASNFDYTYDGQISDEIKWRDLYGFSYIDQTDFGDLTSVYTIVKANSTSLSIKQRKFNMRVIRKLPVRVSGSTFGALTATKKADAIISAICLDAFIGNRDVSEVDFDNIYDTIADIITYFGTDKAAEFSATFSDDNLSFEEIIHTVAQAVFSIAYRRGSQLKISFEKATEMATLLFNHRNKVPGTEVRTIRFGNLDGADGLELTYADPKDDAAVTYILPPTGTQFKPTREDKKGVRSKLQAHFHANRDWNKIQFQNTNVEFEALSESALLIRNDKILLADNTRPDTIDGEVINQSGLIIELSQEADLSVGTYTIHLTHIDATVEAMTVTAGVDDWHAVLDHAPLLDLALDDDLHARAQYVIVKDTDVRPTGFLISERTPETLLTSKVIAYNYDDRYYAHDKDFIDEIIDEDGEII